MASYGLDRVRSAPDDLARQAAAEYLRELLLRPGRPRRTWEQYAERTRHGQVNQLAVAEVLARYLWRHPKRPGDGDLLPRQLKDTAARALSGRLLSKATLELFMEAFALPDAEQDQLWRLWEGSPRVRMLTGARAIRPDTADRVAAVLGPPGHQTVSLHDHAFVRADGQIGGVRTIQVIEALRDGLDSIPYIYDTAALTLRVGHGCEAPVGPGSQVKDGPYILRIPLARTLSAGETLSLEYATTFHYQDVVTAEQRQYRRAVMRRVDNIDLRVEFDPEYVPLSVWWAVWDGVEGGVIEQHRVQPDSQNSVHRYLRLVEKTVAGFYWEDQDRLSRTNRDSTRDVCQPSRSAAAQCSRHRKPWLGLPPLPGHFGTGE
jgi:hypothetical protein